MSVGEQMTSFDVKLFFTNVSLDRKINIILIRIYNHKEFKASITRCEMKEFLTPCTKKNNRNAIHSHTMERSLYKPMALPWGHHLDLY